MDVNGLLGLSIGRCVVAVVLPFKWPRLLCKHFHGSHGTSGLLINSICTVCVVCTMYIYAEQSRAEQKVVCGVCER